MALLRSFENHEYWPEYSTFLLRDSGPGGPARVPVGELLGEYAVDTQPCGSVARAGDGWLDGRATDRHHTVRLESHDSEPRPDPAAWADVMETPMASGGTIALALVTGGSHGDPFRLGQPGLYRARFCRRPAQEGDSYLVQFWPVDSPPDPPRWIARSRPLVEHGDDGWADVLGRQAAELIWAIRDAAADAGRVTVEDLAAWALRHHRPADWLHEQLPPAAADPAHGAGPAATPLRPVDLAEAARQLGAAVPATRTDLLPLLVAGGVVRASTDPAGAPGYQVVERPRPVWEVLRLPDEQVAAIRRRDAHRRYCYAASDLISLLLWAGESGTTVTLSWLADRLLTSPSTVGEIIDFAIDTGKLEPAPESDALESDARESDARESDAGESDARKSDAGEANARESDAGEPHGPHDDNAREPGDRARPGDPDGHGEPLRLRVRPRQPARPRSVAAPAARPIPARRAGVTPARKAVASMPARAAVRAAGARASAARIAVASRQPPPPPAPPAGAPPRAGVVGRNGQFVLWRDGQPLVRATWPDAHPSCALQSRHGTVVLASTQAVLFDHDGHPHRLGTDMGQRAAIDPDGHRLALAETHTGRRLWSRLHLFDLRDRSRQTMPWPQDDARLQVIAVHDGVVYFRSHQPGHATWRWQPGSDPQPVPYRLQWIDPYTGTAVASDQDPGLLLVDPDGTVRRLGTQPTVTLAPGARYLYTWRHDPPALMLSDVSTPDQARTLDLPAGSHTSVTTPARPIWEDPEHVLVPAEHGRNEMGVPLVRIDVRTGVIEGITLPEGLAHRPLLVEPLPAPLGS